ncbi:outer membrane porin OpcP [Caballeronia novacaledonica]|uniref:Outer membrane porin OpcP n=1 Tax=Caballeronia novacaledonica TaxID=1544861 RepID=A0A2U3IC14_9BURK|nr:porin [Caballeronia novacaledonica]SPB17740.1 outer membrane porin OpcP [Caballeronia novacaledonica]
MNSKMAVAATMLFASAAAQAQSTVTLFGVLDEGINLTSNAGGHKAWQMSSVDLVTSRWGLKGSEDLGDGLHAIFDLESGFMLDNGAAYYGGRLFGYQSYVGLQSDTLGTLTFGRQLDSVSDVIGLMTANGYWGGYLFSHPLDNDNTDATFHANNSVKFTSNDYGGVSATALYGFSNQAGAFAGNRTYGAGLKYSYATFTIGAVFENLSAPGATSTGSVASDEAGFVAANQKIYGIGASYGAGPATLGLVYTHVNVQQPVSSLYLGDFGVNDASLHFDNIEFNAKYDIQPDLSIAGMYTYTMAHLKQGGSESSMHWNQIGVMAQYFLSKRTGVYTQLVYQKLSGGNTGTPLDTAFIPGAASPSSNSHQMVARIGMTHSF